MSDETTVTTTDDPALLPGTAEERADEERYGLSAISPSELPLLPGELRPHPSPFQYVMIAVILCVITGLEVGMYYIESDVPKGFYIATLLTMALIKFVTVVSFYMHLRTDRPIFRRFFITGAVGAVVLFTIVLSTLHVWA
jgi:cytochrome c oxidase subunit 4